jgi:hypothetical protein
MHLYTLSGLKPAGDSQVQSAKIEQLMILVKSAHFILFLLLNLNTTIISFHILMVFFDEL